MQSIPELQALVQQGETNWTQYGNVNAVYNDGLILFNYTSAAQFENRWNWFERVSRGLIMDACTGEVVARPFDKFFNLGEGGRYPSRASRLREVTEKLDGSLGILHRLNGEYRIATRGSFNSDQALWATEFLHHYDLSGLPNELTLLFEIIYPSNRIVVDYGNREGLVLIGVRDRFAGEDYLFHPTIHELAQKYRLEVPRTYQFNSIAEILETAGQVDANTEGWVLRFSNGVRFKIKGDRYREVHRFISHISFKRVVETMAERALDEMIANTPDEFLHDVREWQAEIKARVAEVHNRVAATFRQAPKITRKGFALWVKEHHPEDAPYLFAMLDDRDITGMIYKREFQGW